MKQAAVELSSAGGPLVIRTGLCGLISATSLSLLPSPQPPQPTAVNTLQTHREQSLFPGHVHKWAPKVSHRVSLAQNHSLLVDGVGSLERGGRQNPPQAIGPLRCVEDSCPQKQLSPSRWAMQALGAVESFPRRQSFPCEPRLALEAAPNPCQQHFKLWPAQCYILTGQALLA